MPPSPTARVADKENTFYRNLKGLEQRKQTLDERARPVLGDKSANIGSRASLAKAGRQQSLPLQRQSLGPPRSINVASRSSSVDSSSIRPDSASEPSMRPITRERALYPRPLHPIDFAKLELYPEIAKPAPDLLDYDIFDCDNINYRIRCCEVILDPILDLDAAPDFEVDLESDISTETF